ncbi:WD40-repeat-containing domain protein [Ochromonadaceae sp. CCMP2298]|nr:WD40-repeat-containing domain protein [Ochromonadaceae sp. CCMP2298]
MNSASEATPQPLLRIAACSYEGSLFGWSVDENAEQLELTSNLTFGFNVSKASLKAIARSESGKYLVVGGMDERIHIYDMYTNKAVGELSQHTGAVTSLSFYKDSYLISGSEDFSLCIWRVYDWQCVHILGGHKNTINDFSIHPTGMLAMSVSKDHTMKLWNLVQGRCAFTRRLKHISTEQVVWHPSGQFYMLVSANEVELFLASDNSCAANMVHRSRVNRATFTNVGEGEGGWRIATVCDNKSLNLFNISGAQTACVDLTPLGNGRPRDIWSSDINSSAVQQADMLAAVSRESACLVVATSMGQVLVLGVGAVEALGLQGQEGTEEASVETALLSSHQLRAEPRMTALLAWNPVSAAALAKVSKKRAHTPHTLDILGEVEGAEDDLDIKKRKLSQKADSGKNKKASAPAPAEPIQAAKGNSATDKGGKSIRFEKGASGDKAGKAGKSKQKTKSKGK